MKWKEMYALEITTIVERMDSGSPQSYTFAISTCMEGEHAYMERHHKGTDVTGWWGNLDGHLHGGIFHRPSK